MRVGSIALVVGLLTFGLVACGGSPAATKPKSTPKPSGTANVAYAASLENLNEKVIGPDFTKKTGYPYQGRGAGSKAVSADIASGEISPNVFESVGGKPIEALEPKFTSWYVQFAASPIVLAYNPQSQYASQFEAIAKGTKPISSLFSLLETPGLKLGRTDPNVDPQGAAFIEMLMLAQQTYNLPSDTVQNILGAPASSSSSPEIFDEAAVLPRLQAGQLDCSSAYLSEAVQLHLKYISLPASINLGDPSKAADYAKATFTLASGEAATGAPAVIDITTIGTTDKAAADAFVAYVLSSKGLALHKQGGYSLLKPKIFGKKSAAPAAVRKEIS
ncbi:MAG TPA: extracellular solute-binding protein [Candidatus Dormibacteraeota bacterium]|jgi:molybdate/tungstate transport system substrate-binding protein|nr:extracellular solute-binding protein [Candidatus Dormibacteraeota bacterium]